MASNIDASKPIFGNPDTASVRANFAAAKTELEALQSAANSLLASVNALTASGNATQAEADALQAALTPLQNRVDALEAKDVNLQEQINGINSTISTINQTLGNHAGRIQSLESDSTSQASRLSALESAVNTPNSGIQADLNATKARVTALEVADVFQISSASSQMLAGHYFEQTVIDFDSASTSNPSGAFSFDSALNEVTISAVGYYSVSIFATQRTDPASYSISSKWAMWAAGKPPSGFGFSVIEGSVAYNNRGNISNSDVVDSAVAITFVFRVNEAGTKIKFFQAGSVTELGGAGGTPSIGIAKIDSASVFPDGKSCTVFIQKIGEA